MGLLPVARFARSRSGKAEENFVVQSVTGDLQCLAGFEFSYRRQGDIEGEKVRTLNHAGNRLWRPIFGEQNGLNRPNAKRDIIDSAFGSPTIDSFPVGLQQYTPVNECPQHTSRGAGYGFAFAQLFADAALHLSCGRGSLQAKQPPGCVGDRAEERVDRHAHTPVHEDSVIRVQTLKKLQSFVTKRLKLRRNRYPDLCQNRDGLVPVAPFRIVSNRQPIL